MNRVGVPRRGSCPAALWGEQMEITMLSETKAYSGIAATDMAEARRFYAETLELRTSEPSPTSSPEASRSSASKASTTTPISP